jgi:hypothetical protein
VPNPIPDLDGWEAYCDKCGAFREARRAEAHDVSDGSEYFEFLCNTCYSILLTFQRVGTQSEEKKLARPVALARCPFCGEMNSFPVRTDLHVRLPALRPERGRYAARAIGTAR